MLIEKYLSSDRPCRTRERFAFSNHTHTRLHAQEPYATMFIANKAQKQKDLLTIR